MLSRALTVCLVLLIKVPESFGSTRKYNDFFYYTTYKGSNVTWMIMPDDNGVVVSALLGGVTPQQNVTDQQVEFILWTRKTQKKPEKIILGEGSSKPLDFKTFKGQRKTVFLIHGFTDTMKPPEFFNTLVPAFLKQDDYNVIGVNWTSLSSLPWYGEAVKNSIFAGFLTAEAIKAVRKRSGKHNAKIHVVAFNLGTLVAGVAATYMKGRKIERITGLDPPYILTNELPDSRKLDKGDADLVEIIHTSGDYIGINAAVGHRDFYPNNGKWPQPGCLYDLADRCSPRRAYHYYAESLTKKNSFIATKCSSYESYILNNCKDGKTLPMFNNAPSQLEGKFYLRTNREAPFSQV